MRAVLLAGLLLAAPAVVVAEPIELREVFVDYTSYAEAINIEVWLNRPLDMERERLQVRVYGIRGTHLQFTYSNGTFRNPEDTFNIRTWLDGGGLAEIVGYAPTTFSERIEDGETLSVISATIPASRVHWPQYPYLDTEPLLGKFSHWTHVFFDDEQGRLTSVSTSGYATVNFVEYVPPIPEPSSFALASLGVVLLGVHVVRRRRARAA